ncbi:MAG: spore cortex-lytic protein [Eubacterium sp.]|nr:spore cortex-lytic protein [Eubacterium sp.]
MEYIEQLLRRKKSTAPHNRTAQRRASTATNETKPERMITQRNRKSNKKRAIIEIIGLVILMIVLIVLLVCSINSNKQKSTTASSENSETVTAETIYFVTSEGTPIDMQNMTAAWAAEAGFEKRYELTDAERYEIAQVVTAEAGGEPYAGKVAVAQCILQSAEDDNIRPITVLTRYSYTRTRPEPTAEALDAVADVFDFGHVATRQPIKYFYNPEMVSSSFHESQVYVMTINHHKFFKEAPAQ